MNTCNSLPNPQRIMFMGCSIDNLTMEETLETVERFIATGTPHQHVAVNVDKLVKAQSDPELRQDSGDNRRDEKKSGKLKSEGKKYI